MNRALPGFHAFTQQNNGIVHQLITEASISEAYNPNTDPKSHPKQLQTTALWDTGATGCVITPAIARNLALVPTGVTMVGTAGGQRQHSTFLVNLTLPNSVGFSGVAVTMMDEMENSNFGIIIGMNVIAAGDFAVTNAGGKTCFSFRVPSVQRIDYVAEFNAKLKSVVGPNEPCPCGAPKKYKKCHGARA